MDELVKLMDGAMHWSLDYDDHRSNYQTIDEWCDDALEHTDDESEKRCIESCRDSGHVWTLRVYPTTPIGFYKLHAPTFERVVAGARALRPTLDVEFSLR